MSSKVSEKELILNLKRLFYENETDNEIKDNSEQESEEFTNDTLIILNEIKIILQNCSNLTDKQKLEYCNSQRYFMKLYLKELNKK
jgi:hypothetical protein